MVCKDAESIRAFQKSADAVMNAVMLEMCSAWMEQNQYEGGTQRRWKTSEHI